MADVFTQWDAAGPGRTAWDDVADGPGETQWDLSPDTLGDGQQIRWTDPGRFLRWAHPGRSIKWLSVALSRLITASLALCRWGAWRRPSRTHSAMT